MREENQLKVGLLAADVTSVDDRDAVSKQTFPRSNIFIYCTAMAEPSTKYDLIPRVSNCTCLDHFGFGLFPYLSRRDEVKRPTETTH